MANGRLVFAYEMQDFLKCIEDAQLVSPRSVGHWFSWHNKASGVDRITSHIDHAFVNEQWMDKVEHTVIQYLNHANSDHTPLVCQIGGKDSGKGRPFWFLNYRADHRDFLGIVEEAWRSKVKGVALVR